MNDEPLHTLTQMQAFLDGTLAVEFSMVVEEGDGFIARTVRRFVVGDLGVVPYEPEGRVLRILPSGAVVWRVPHKYGNMGK